MHIAHSWLMNKITRRHVLGERELYSLIKLLINIERTVDLYLITKKNKKEIHMHTQEL